MDGEVRVTVIATGCDKGGQQADLAAAPGRAAPGVLPFRERPSRPTPVTPPGYAKPAEPPRRPTAQPPAPADVSEMEIPTFIRRQMACWPVAARTTPRRPCSPPAPSPRPRV